jgi:hypothetical protein
MACLAALAFALTVVAEPARAVIIRGDQGRLTSPPLDTAGKPAKGWQYQGRWKVFLGTPISPRHFITAGHVGGAVGQAFTYNGVNYTTSAMYDDPASDLRIWQVGGRTFPSYAPLYTATAEKGRMSLVYGRGTRRGAEVRVNNALKGWRWGGFDGVQSWGQNAIDGVVTLGTGTGQLLHFDFDRTGAFNEAAVSGGDSGGGLFVKDNGVWKLAGINYGVDGPFSLDGTADTQFLGAMLDTGGLYTKQKGVWKLNPDSAVDTPASGYATRISSNMAWINSVRRPRAALTADASPTIPEPLGLAALALVGAGMLARRRRR